MDQSTRLAYLEIDLKAIRTALSLNLEWPLLPVLREREESCLRLVDDALRQLNQLALMKGESNAVRSPP